MDRDKNTRCFHGKASHLRKTNNIKRLKDERGNWCAGPSQCEKILIDYFSSIYSSSNPSGIDEVCCAAGEEIDATTTDLCSTPFEENEVKESIFQMHPTKAPRPDGLPTLFFHKYWSTVGKDVVVVALEVLNNQRDPDDINSTFIALIPKIKQPRYPHKFRPISLCNVIMKAVTKSIANRMKTDLPSVISEEQSAFIRGRLITENTLIAMECFHWMKNKKVGKKCTLALKLDMSKAYDRIEWDFVDGALKAFGFPLDFMKLVRRCIST